MVLPKSDHCGLYSEVTQSVETRLFLPMGEQRLIDDLRRLVRRLQEDATLLEPHELHRRLEALDSLDARFAEGCLPGAETDLANLYQDTKGLRLRLEAANEFVCESIRHEIRRDGRTASLLRWARSAPDEELGNRAGGLGYGFLDELISGVLRFEDPGGNPVLADPEMVAYQPTPARHIFHLIEAAELAVDDLLIDLGSGLGHVPLLVSICTPAHSIGIELELSYVHQARQCAERLNLNRVAFLQQDAREADLSAGTIFYLYTPFTGSILRSVLDRLRDEASQRRIRVCTYGPCTPVIAEEPWLEASAAPSTDRMTLFRSRLAG